MREANSVSRRLCSSVKRTGLSGFNVEHADHPVLRDQRHCQLRTHTGSGVDEILLGGHVVHQQGFAPLRRLPRDTLPDLDANAVGDLRRMPYLEAHAKLLLLVVQQQDGEDLIVDEALQHLRHTLQQGVEVQRGIDRVGHFQQIAVEAGRH